MNTLYNNLVKSFSNSDWKSVKWYRDEIKAFSELSEISNEIKENNGDAKLKEFDEELKKIKKKGKIKTALAILVALAGVGLIAKNSSNLNKLAEAHNRLGADFKEAKNNLYENDLQIADKVDEISGIPEENLRSNNPNFYQSHFRLKYPNFVEWKGRDQYKYE